LQGYNSLSMYLSGRNRLGELPNEKRVTVGDCEFIPHNGGTDKLGGNFDLLVLKSGAKPDRFKRALSNPVGEIAKTFWWGVESG